MAFTTIQGSGANDATTFVGTSGVDTINLLNVANPVFLSGQGANDVITFDSFLFSNIVSNYTLRGGDGNDTIEGAGGITIFDGATFNSGFINGNAGNDTITLLAVNDSTVFGGKGADIIITLALTNSRVNGNEGNDSIDVTGATSSSIFGGKGQDTLAVSGAVVGSVIQGDDDSDTINLTDTYTNSTINGNAGDDLITIGAITGFTASTVFGGAGNDTITAATSTVAVVISGDNGNDTIIGSNFADTIFGGAGNDTITGGDGADRMTGGAGVNTYLFADSESTTANVTTGVVDVITDFKNTGVSTTWDIIDVNGAAGVLGTTFLVSTLGTVSNSYAAALANASSLINGTVDYSIQAVGSGTSWTAYLFTNDEGVGTVAAGAIQLGTTGQFGTATLALGAISAAQIIA